MISDPLGSCSRVTRLLLVSGTDVGKRVDQHRAVIQAAGNAGVQLIAYTSVLRADSSTLPIAGEHLATETLLRNAVPRTTEPEVVILGS